MNDEKGTLEERITAICADESLPPSKRIYGVLTWIEGKNRFCGALVDRHRLLIPGTTLSMSLPSLEVVYVALERTAQTYINAHIEDPYEVEDLEEITP